MGLDNIVDDVEEDVKSLNDEEIEGFIDRFEAISQIVIAQQKRIEDLEDEVEMLKNQKGDSFLEDETGGGSDSSWG